MPVRIEIAIEEIPYSLHLQHYSPLSNDEICVSFGSIIYENKTHKSDKVASLLHKEMDIELLISGYWFEKPFKAKDTETIKRWFFSFLCRHITPNELVKAIKELKEQAYEKGKEDQK